MIWYRLATVLLIFFSCSSEVLFISAESNFIASIHNRGMVFARQKSTFSSEKPESKKNAILQASSRFPNTRVCTVDGSYIGIDTDIKLSTFRTGIQRFYRSLPDRTGLFGSGWKLNYEIQLYPLDFDGAPAIAVEKADGQIIIFQQGKAGFISPWGNLFKLTQKNDGTYLLTELGTRQIFFDKHGQLSKIIENKNVKPLEMLYKPTTNLLTEIRSGSKTIVRFMYNANGHVEAVEDFTGRRYSYHYDAAKRLIRVIDPLQQSLQYQYDENGYLQAIIDKRGNFQTEVTYTPTGIVKSYTRNGEKYQVQYLNETQTSFTDSQGHQWIYSYLPSGLITQTQDPYGNTSSLEFDGFLRPIQVTDKRGAITKYMYDDVNRTQRIINPLGSVTTHFHKEGEWVIKAPTGKIMTFHFNENGDLVEETVGTDEKVLSRNHYVYDSTGNLVQHIDPNGNTTQFAYNSDRFLVQKIDGAGNITHWRYDNLGRIVWEKDPIGRITETSYDLMGRVIERNRSIGSASE